MHLNAALGRYTYKFTEGGVVMSNQCVNILRFEGEDEDISKFLKWVESNDNFGQYLLNQEKEGESEDNIVENLSVESAYPWVDTFHISKDEITWDSRNYPSVISVIKLSKKFPSLTFTLNYEQTGGDYKGILEISDGEMTEEEIVDYDKEPLDILVDDYNILSLVEGDKIESIGQGMVDVVCKSVKQEEGITIKTFNIIFQCDESPMFVIQIDEEGSIVDYEYSDDDQNESIEDSEYYDEMVSDLQ